MLDACVVLRVFPWVLPLAILGLHHGPASGSGSAQAAAKILEAKELLRQHLDARESAAAADRDQDQRDPPGQDPDLDPAAVPAGDAAPAPAPAPRYQRRARAPEDVPHAAMVACLEAAMLLAAEALVATQDVGGATPREMQSMAEVGGRGWVGEWRDGWVDVGGRRCKPVQESPVRLGWVASHMHLCASRAEHSLGMLQGFTIESI